jgi:hypothetical protein
LPVTLGMRVGRVAFKKGVDPPGSSHASALPSCIAPFHLPSHQMGAPVLPSPCRCWRSATSWWLVLFRHRSTSRIFIMQLGCSPSPMVIQDDDHQFRGGGEQAGLRPLPHPQLQGCSSSLLWRRAGRAGVLPPAWAGKPPLPSVFRGEGAHRPCGGGKLRQRGTGRKRRHLQRAWLAGSAGSGAASDAASCRLVRAWSSVHRMGDCCAVRTGGSSKTSYAARAAFVSLDCLVLTPVRRLHVEAGAGPSART